MRDECAIHGYEPVPNKYYKICNECWHCFVTAEDLENADLERRKEVMPDRPHVILSASVIKVCPECTHDF